MAHNVKDFSLELTNLLGQLLPVSLQLTAFNMNAPQLHLCQNRQDRHLQLQKERQQVGALQLGLEQLVELPGQVGILTGIGKGLLQGQVGKGGALGHDGAEGNGLQPQLVLGQ